MSADAARQLHRLTVLLSAGLSPVAAWSWLAEQAGAAPSAVVLRAAAAAAAEARPLGPALLAAADGSLTDSAGGVAEVSAWRVVAAAWELASIVGAPLSPALTGLTSVLRARAQRQRELRVALAGPRATSRMLLWLPLAGTLLASVLGIGVLQVLLGSVTGWALSAVAALLLWGGRRWMRGILRRAEPGGELPGMPLELMAVALSGGAAASTARAAWQRTLDAFGLSRAADEAALLEAVLALSDAAGAPAAGLLRAEAEVLRAEAEAADRERIEAAAVRLLIPLGACILPAFVLLTVVPAVIAILSATLGL